MPGWRDLLISICDENKKHMSFRMEKQPLASKLVASVFPS